MLKCGADRVCSHFFHEHCARQLPSQHCPMCRAEFTALERLPLLSEDAEGWFRCVALGRGELGKSQVMEALVTQFPLDVERFEEALEQLWPRWDHDQDGAISRAEFFRPEVGLLDFVRTNLLRQRVALVPVPDISQERLRWFEHFDEEKTGSLKQEELVRALIKTYSLASDLGQVRQMRELVSAVWPLFDLDGTGRVSQQEFLRPGDGLADAIIASRAS